GIELVDGVRPLHEGSRPRTRACRGLTPSRPQADARRNGRKDHAFGHRIICVLRNWAMGRAAPSGVTVASQTCVVRPWCRGRATQTMVPSRALPKKLLLSSMVAKPTAH